MADRRVVITGLGIINALGQGIQEYFSALLDGVVGVDRIKAFDPSGFPCQVGAESISLKMNKIVPKAHRKATKLMSRDIELAVVAADLAVRDAKLRTKGTGPEEKPNIDVTRSGVNIGTVLNCCDLVELAAAVEHGTENGKFSYSRWGAEGMESLTPLWLLKYLPNMLSCHISIIHDLQGHSNAITCAEAGGQLSAGEAFRIIARGDADLMIAGGAECKVNPMTLLRQCLLGRVSTNYNDRPDQASRPFDRDADGTVMGEGAGIVVLEELEHARKRNADIYAEVKGFGASNNFSEDFVEPESGGKGITIALRKAMQQARLSGDQVQLLIPHGIGVANHDGAEAAGIRAAFGEYAAELPIFATKSRIGNCGGGAGAIDLVTTVLALHEAKIPATLNSPNPPAEYGLNINQNNVEKKIENALTCCYTFGGQTAALAVSKMKD